MNVARFLAIALLALTLALVSSWPARTACDDLQALGTPNDTTSTPRR